MSSERPSKLPTTFSFIPEHDLLSWESQVVQYPTHGEPGIGYFRGEWPDRKEWVDCLLYRNQHGHVVGILNHYPFNLRPWEEAGNVNLWVRPDHQLQGIGTALLAEAEERWGPLRWEQFKYTWAGYKFAQRYLERT